MGAGMVAGMATGEDGGDAGRVGRAGVRAASTRDTSRGGCVGASADAGGADRGRWGRGLMDAAYGAVDRGKGRGAGAGRGM